MGIDTIRLPLLKLAGRIQETVRKIWLSFASVFALQIVFVQAPLANLRRAPVSAAGARVKQLCPEFFQFRLGTVIGKHRQAAWPKSVNSRTARLLQNCSRSSPSPHCRRVRFRRCLSRCRGSAPNRARRNPKSPVRATAGNSAFRE